ncbi:MAG: hypothetical protein J6U92_02075 [Clostridia bacterium]|nr:hypothetical protein [Clostridia bacterium]
MFEIIGVIIYGLAIGAWWMLKFSLKALYYTLPIWIVFIGFYFGGAMGNGCFGSLADDYKSEVKKIYTHQITIYWDDLGNDYTTMSVREDLNWCLKPSRYSSGDLYESYTCADTEHLPDKAKKSGWVFKGLYDMPNGIENPGVAIQYVDENGCSLMRVTENIELYACWELAEVA